MKENEGRGITKGRCMQKGKNICVRWAVKYERE
jgi:hypothetical protein